MVDLDVVIVRLFIEESDYWKQFWTKITICILIACEKKNFNAKLIQSSIHNHCLLSNNINHLAAEYLYPRLCTELIFYKPSPGTTFFHCFSLARTFFFGTRVTRVEN